MWAGGSPAPYLKLVHSHGEARDRWHCSGYQIMKNCTSLQKNALFKWYIALLQLCGVDVGRVTRIEVVLFQFNNALHLYDAHAREGVALYLVGRGGHSRCFFHLGRCQDMQVLGWINHLD